PHIACTEDRYLHHLRDDSLEREPPILTPAKAARRLPGRNGRRARISSRPSACLLTILRLLTVRVTGGRSRRTGRRRAGLDQGHVEDQRRIRRHRRLRLGTVGE